MKLNLPQAVFMGSLDVRVTFAEVPEGMDSFLKSCNQQKRKGRYGFELIFFVELCGYLFFFVFCFVFFFKSRNQVTIVKGNEHYASFY